MTGGKRRPMCASETSGGSTASPRSAAASACVPLRCDSRLTVRRQRRGSEPEEAIVLLLQPLE